MMKRVLALLLLCLWPLGAFALEYREEGNAFLVFPEMDEWQGRFSRRDRWVIVTKETLAENWELVAARGGTEEEIRARYAADTFLFEAYSPDIAADACFRAERFENEITQEIWNLRHWDNAERKRIIGYLESGRAFPGLEVSRLNVQGRSPNHYLRGYFTNEPPATLESGRIRIDFRNGRMYVFSYCVSGRVAGTESAFVQDSFLCQNTPLLHERSVFLNEALPRKVNAVLKNTAPEDALPGNIRLSGTADAGAQLAVTLNGSPVTGMMNGDGSFIVILPLKECGEYEAELSFTHPKLAERSITHTIRVSEERTPLTVTKSPEEHAGLGEMTISGLTEPGAGVALRMGETELAACSADKAGKFTCSFEVDEPGVCTVQLTVQAEGRSENTREISFHADYESREAALEAYEKKVQDVPLLDMQKNADAYIGSIVKLPVFVVKMEITPQGLSAVCRQEKLTGNGIWYYLYHINIDGYAGSLCREGAKMTVYGEVTGTAPCTFEDGTEYILPAVQAAFISETN